MGSSAASELRRLRVVGACRRVVHDPDQEAAPGEPRKESARVIVTLADGTVHERFVPYLVGFPSHPMSREDVESKALDDAAELVRLVAS